MTAPDLMDIDGKELAPSRGRKRKYQGDARERHLAAMRARVLRLKAAGLCVTCGLDKGDRKQVRCEICARKMTGVWKAQPSRPMVLA